MHNMKITIKTSEVEFEFEDHVEEAANGYARHYMPEDTNKWITQVVKDVIELHNQVKSER